MYHYILHFKAPLTTPPKTSFQGSIGMWGFSWIFCWSFGLFTNKRVSCWAQYLALVAMPFPQSDSNDTHTWQELVNEQLSWSCSTTCGASWLVDWIRMWRKCLVFSHWRAICNHWLASPEMWGRNIQHEEKPTAWVHEVKNTQAKTQLSRSRVIYNHSPIQTKATTIGVGSFTCKP